MTEKKREDGRLGPSVNNICSSNNKTLPPRNDYTFKDLPPIIQQLAENKVINLIPLKSGSKKPKVRWKSYQQRQYPLKALLEHKGNFGVITGSNGGSWSNLVILDIDDKKGPEGLFRHFKALDTMQVKTASKGYHIYFWSEKPVQDANILNKVFNLDLELRGKREIYCVIPPSSINYEDGYTGGHELLKMGSEYPILELEDVEDYIKTILIKAGHVELKQAKSITKTNESQDPLIIREGWVHELQPDQLDQLVKLLKPLYIEGQRQKLVLYLSGWMYKAEVSPKSANKVISKLSKGDSEFNLRLTALRNSYRGIEERALKGSSGVFEIIKKQIPDKKGKLLFNAIRRILIHPYSFLGIQQCIGVIRTGSKGKNTAIKAIHQFLRARYEITKDRISGEIHIYNPETGYYEPHDDNMFHEFLSVVFGDEIFTMDETKMLKSIFAKTAIPSSSHIIFNNGLLNLDSLKLEEFTPEHFLTFRVPYDWNPNARGGFVEEKLREILIDDDGDSRKFDNYLEVVGYCFYEGNPHQKIFLFVGEPGSGKTQLINLISGIFRGSVSSVPLKDFNERFGLQPLIGKRVNTLYDISGEEIRDPSVIKAVSGGDSITIDRKFKTPLTFETGLPVKTIGAGNLFPKIRDSTGAMGRRLNISKLNNNFNSKPIKDLSVKLLESTEGVEWLLYISITKYRELLDEDRGFSMDFTPEEAEMEYLMNADPCKYAMRRLYEFTNDENDFYSSTELITSINRLLLEEGLRVPKNSRQHHHPAIRAIGGERVQRRINNEVTWGYSLIRARLPDRDPKNIRLDKETFVDLIPQKRAELISDSELLEKNLLELLDGKGPYNLVGVIMDAWQEYGMDKNDVMNILMNWRDKGVLKIDNSEYE